MDNAALRSIASLEDVEAAIAGRLRDFAVPWEVVWG